MTDRPTRRRWPAWTGTAVVTAAILATMSWGEPPRYDGAGYATLGRSIALGRGYREIHRPEAPRHTHFPPAYPAALAVAWTLAGVDNFAGFTRLAHGLSVLGVAAGAWGMGRWWAATEPRGVALALTLALAANWTWIRTGGVIRSEPLAIALGALVLLRARAGSGWFPLGVLLGVGVLTRQVFACWVAAVAVDLGLRRGWAAAVRLFAVVATVVAPWIAWQAAVGSGSQSGLFRRAGLGALMADQTMFYTRRLPDTIAGPFVEVATVFARIPQLGLAATLGAGVATAVIGAGWVRLTLCPRTRLGGLIPLATLPLLLAWPFTEAGRFLIPLVPFVLMGAAEGLGMVLRRVRVRVRRPRTWAAGLVLAASIPYSAYAVVSQRAAAERRTQRGFDSACAWVAGRRAPAGTVMARHPADAAWLTGRLAVTIPVGDPDQVATAIRRDGVAFLLIDEGRYARSEDNPLRAFVETSRAARRVGDDHGSTAVYQVEALAPPSNSPR